MTEQRKLVEKFFTESQITKAARYLSDMSAEACNIDKEDNWKTYSEQYIAEAEGALLATTSTESSASPVPRAQGGNTCNDERWNPDEQAAFSAWAINAFPNESSQGLISLGSAWKQGQSYALRAGGSSPADAGGLTPERIAAIYQAEFNASTGAARQAPSRVPELVIDFGRAIEREVIATKAAQPVREFVVDVEALKQQSEAWFAVCNVRNEVRYGWAITARNGMESAVATIRALAATSASASPAAPTEAEIRAAALEEAAKACDKRAIWNGAEADEKDNTERNRATFGAWRDEAEGCARTIRALAASPAAAVAAPAPAPVVGSQQVREMLRELVQAMRDYQMDVDHEGPAPEKHRDMMRRAESMLAAAPAVPVPAEQEDSFARGIIAALGVLNVHGYPHGSVIHDEIVRSAGEASIYAAAEDEDYRWAGLDPSKKPVAAPSLQQPKTGSQP